MSPNFPSHRPPRHVAVVGGGITGLTAALRICDRTAHNAAPTRVTLVEQSEHLGGKLRSARLEWSGTAQHVELGADAFLVRGPTGSSAGIELVERLGLGPELMHPHTGQAYIALAEGLRVLPRDTVMGVPASPEAMADAGLVSAASAARMLAERDAPGEPVTDDVSVGTLTRRRLGNEVTENVISPLLGGVYAGDTDVLSLQATIPALAARLRDHPSLVRAAQAVSTSRAGTGPTFAAIRGGMGRLVSVLEETLRSMRSNARPQVDLRCGTTVRRLRRMGEGWELTLDPAGGGEVLHADAVLVATPARAARRLVEEAAPNVAAELAGIEYASVAVINIVLPDTASDGISLPVGSGVLVPSLPGRAVKAVTFVDQKWGRGAPETRLLRASVGRHGDETALQREDADLIEAVLADLARILGPLPPPLAAHVQRWGGSLPQYLVGHPARVRRARERIAAFGGLALAGAGYDGVGIAACISSAHQAADQLVGADSVRPAEPIFLGKQR